MLHIHSYLSSITNPVNACPDLKKTVERQRESAIGQIQI